MKVLSIKEPYATLIMQKRKKIETRSWKTNYRGELYIHASKSIISKELIKNKELMDLLDNTNFNYGKIICKCRLVDCIYMSKEYITNLKKNNYLEYLLGDYKEGRYAWILEDIVVMKQQIVVNGKLGIWNYEP